MLAGFFRKSSTLPDRVILVIDCSVSMQATDVAPSRIDYAKEQAINYVRQLDQGAQITVITLKDIPEILITDETNQGLVTSAIKDLQAIDAYGDMELCLQITSALKQNTQIPVVYFGDRTYPGAENMKIVKSDDNASVNNVSYTLYESEGVMSVLADISNDGNQGITTSISLYGDDVLLDAKQVEIEPQTGGKIFFDDVPISTVQLKVVLDRKDILEIDNTAYGVVTQEKVKKAVLVTQSNVFLEKVLKLNKGLEVYLAEPKDIETLKGFDLYIFDGVLPKELPLDGAMLLFNPPDNDHFTNLGYAKNSELFTSGHAITHHLEQLDFAVGVTQVFEVPTWAQAFIDTEYGVCAFAGTYKGVRTVVFGFDLHHTDLPLVVDFPIMMSNVADYLVPNSLLGATSISAGETMSIRISPRTEEAYIISPDNSREYLELTKEEALYKNTYLSGIYTLVQKVQDTEISEQFGVNVPKAKPLSDLQTGTKNQTFEATNRKSLMTLLGIGALILLSLEWFIYHYRRKINAIKR